MFPEKTKELFIEVDLVAKLDVLNPFDFFLEPGADRYPFTYDPALRKELRPYLEVQPAGPLLEGFLKDIPRQQTRTIDFLVELNRRLQQQIQYVIRLAPGVQSCEETLHLRRGSCRDSGWLLVQVLRHLGLAARFVSGYLIQLTPGCQTAGWPRRPDDRFHGFACLDRGLSPRRGLDRSRSNLWATGRRRAHSIGLLAGPCERRTRDRSCGRL